MNVRARFSVLSLLVAATQVCPATVFAGSATSGQPAARQTPAAIPTPPPPPPADPAGLSVFTLDNGLTVWLHPVPGGNDPSRVGIALAVQAGPLDEADDQIGAAYLAKRAAGLGTAHASSAALDRVRAGFGRSGQGVRAADGGHATLTHEGVVHTMVFDPGDEAGWNTTLGHFSDLLSGWSVDDAQLDDLRTLAAERIGSFTPDDTARRAFVSEVFAGQRLAQRPLIPEAEVITRTSPDAVRRFIGQNYRPDRATLVVVGRFDVGDVLARVRATMGAISVSPSNRAKPEDALGISASVAGRAAVLTVPGYEPAEVSLLSVRPTDGTGGDATRRAVLDAVAAELVAARARPAVAMAEAGVVSVDTGVKAWIDGAVIAEVSVRVEQAGLRRAGQAAATELARIARGGFGTEEVRSARATVLSGFEDAARRWQVTDAAGVMDDLVAAARSRGPDGRATPWVSPVERAGVASRVLASTTDAALIEHARAVFAPGSLACVLIGSEAERMPGDAVARRVLESVGSEPLGAQRVAPERLLADAPAGGLAMISNDPVTGVWSGVLDNGVMVRVRPTPQASGVMVRVTLCDGPGRETAATLGRTRDAVAAWAYPTVGSVGGASIGAGGVRAWSIARGVRFRPVVSEHTVVLEIDADGATGGGAAGDAMTLAAALLAAPGVDAAYADRMSAADTDYGPALRRLTELMFEPGEARARKQAPTERVDPKAATEWLRLIAASPLEVSVVGDLSPEDAMRIATETLGTLARREPPSRHRPRAWGAVPRVETLERVPSGPDAGARGQALVGIVFGDGTDLSTVRPMLIAASAINDELDRVRKEGRLDASPRAWVWLGDGIPDRATLVVWCDNAADPEAAMGIIDRAIERVANGESDAAVIDRGIERARRQVERAWDSPAFWADRLAKLASQGLDISSVAGMPGSYGSITERTVRDTLSTAVGGGVHKRVIAVPDVSRE